METKKSTKSWDGFLGANFLKAEDVKDSETPFVVISVGLDDENEKIRLMLESEKHSWSFDLNVTNANFLFSQGVENPDLLLGKKIYFKKVLVRKPGSRDEVEGLRIMKIE